MKRRHVVAFYCSLLAPCGALLGYGVGSAVGGLGLMTLMGIAAGCGAAFLLAPSSSADESP